MRQVLVDREIEKLKQQLIEISAKVEESIIDCHTAFMKLDRKLAKKVMVKDDIIDEEEVQIEEDCLKILALYQPVASELRMVVGILKMNNDLERMGDLSASVAKCSRKIAKIDPNIAIPAKFDQMFNTTRHMVSMSLDALVGTNEATALDVIKLDDEVDELNAQIIDEVTEAMKKDSAKIDPLTYTW